MKLLTYAFFILSLILNHDKAIAKDFPAQLRLFAASTAVDPSDMNEEMDAQNLEQMDMVYSLGLEATYKLMKSLDVGIRYANKTATLDEDPNDIANEYSAKFNQDAILLLARIPIIRGSVFRFDAFAGFGGTNTALTLKTAGQDGELSRKKGGDWLASPYSSFGASFSFGYKKYYFTIEGGFESNVIKDFDRTGTVNTNIKEIDLSGSYLSVGFMFDGVTATK